MRPIKFRFWKGNILQGILELKVGSILDMAWEWDSVDQFTGLIDKTSKEIYEGDIISIPDDYEKFGFMAGEKREIYFLDGSFRLKPRSQYRNQRGHTIEDSMEDCEVIGNRYENPELLEKI